MDTEREGAAIEMTQQEADEKNTAENREDSIRREYGFAPDVKLKECRFCCVILLQRIFPPPINTCFPQKANP